MQQPDLFDDSDGEEGPRPPRRAPAAKPASKIRAFQRPAQIPSLAAAPPPPAPPPGFTPAPEDDAAAPADGGDPAATASPDTPAEEPREVEPAHRGDAHGLSNEEGDPDGARSGSQADAPAIDAEAAGASLQPPPPINPPPGEVVLRHVVPSAPPPPPTGGLRAVFEGGPLVTALGKRAAPSAERAPPHGVSNLASSPSNTSSTPASTTHASVHLPRDVRPTLRALPSVPPLATLGEVKAQMFASLPSITPPEMPARLKEAAQDGVAYAQFLEVKSQLEQAHNRTIGLHAQLSSMQVSHEKEAAQLQASFQAQVDKQRKELQEMTENYNAAQSKTDQLAGILQRKAEVIMNLEHKLHQAELNVASLQQKAAHTEDRVKLTEQARQVSEVRAHELELSLDHSTNIISTLREQLASAEETKAQALAEQYKAFEENRQQLIHFYSEREQFALGSYSESLQSVLSSMQGYMLEREKEVESKWEETFSTQLEHQKSLHAELVTRAERHVEEVRGLKTNQDSEKEKWLAHMQREIENADARSRERESKLLEDIARRERDLSERESSMRVNLAQAEQDAKIALLTREHEMKATYERLLEQARHEYDKDRERLSAAFKEQLAAIGGQHRANEAELERLHRDKEREMAKSYRIANWETDERRAQADTSQDKSDAQKRIMAKLDQTAAARDARVRNLRAAVSKGTVNENNGGTGHTDPSSGSVP